MIEIHDIVLFFFEKTRTSNQNVNVVELNIVREFESFFAINRRFVRHLTKIFEFSNKFISLFSIITNIFHMLMQMLLKIQIRQIVQ